MLKESSPIMPLGRYAGKPVASLPNSYLRWMLSQKFPKTLLEAAEKKLKASSYSDLYLHVTRHAIDMFSKRFLHLWLTHVREDGKDAVGLASFIATLAQAAWERGSDISKHRHQDDGVVKALEGVQWVFGVNPDFPEYRDVVNVMDGTEE